MKQRQAVIFAILSVLCWSTVGSAFKITLRYVDPLGLLLFSSLVAVLFLLIFLLFQKKPGQRINLSRKSILHSAGLGFINPFLYYVILFKAYDILPAQEAATLNYFWPLALVLLSVPMLKQKIGFLSILAILVSFAGILIITTHGDLLHIRFSSVPGVSLALGSAIVWALYWIFNMKDPREPVGKLFLNFLFGFLYILVLLILLNRLSLPPWQGILGCTYIGLLEMGITFVLWLKALTLSTTTAKVTNLIYISPFLSLIFIHFIVGEAIFLSTFIGLVFIIGGILFQQTLGSR